MKALKALLYIALGFFSASLRNIAEVLSRLAPGSQKYDMYVVILKEASKFTLGGHLYFTEYSKSIHINALNNN